MFLLRTVYRMAWGIVAPAAVLRLLWRARQEPGYAQHILERFGFVARARTNAPRVWIHAVSVGETQAARPLIEALRAARPDIEIVLTHMTPGGRATGISLFADTVSRCYLPYDMRGSVRRFLRRQRPVLGILMETEVWPTLIEECRAERIPLVLANARMSERSHRRAARFGAATREVFGGFTQVYAQTAADARRLSVLGARDVTVFGNLKFDSSIDIALRARGSAWRRAFGSRPVWVAASTREGEEAHVLEAFALLRERFADLLLILVPRHPQRFDSVAELAARRWRVERRSHWGVPQEGMPQPTHSGAAAPGHAAEVKEPVEVPPLAADVAVLLGDSMGEMSAYYASADLAFIGGSLVPTGGQNLIEAAALGVPVLLGPHTFNFAQAARDALACGAALRVADAAELASRVAELLADRPRRAAMCEAALGFAAAHRGATEKSVAALCALLPPLKPWPGLEREPASAVNTQAY